MKNNQYIPTNECYSCKSKNVITECVPDSGCWARTITCNDCGKVYEHIEGDKMGGGFDTISLKGIDIAKEAEKSRNGKDLTLEDFTKKLEKVFGNKETYENLLIYPKHYTWEEDGMQYSAWEISEGVFTGDGGMELFNQAITNELKNLPFKLDDNDK